MSADGRPGFIALPRAIFASSAWKEKRQFSTFEALVDLAGLASFSAREYDYKGTVVHLELRETPPLSVRFLMQRWGWKSTSTVSRFVAELVETGGIVQNSKRNTGPNGLPNTYFVGNRILACLSETPIETSRRTPSRTKEKKEEEQGLKNTPTARAAPEYTEVFNRAWAALPRREESDSKPAAWRSFQARVKQGADPEEMAAGAERYGAYCDATGKSGTAFVKQGKTFFGPDRWFEGEYEIPSSNGNGRHR